MAKANAAVPSMPTVTQEEIDDYRRESSETARKVEKTALVDSINVDVQQFIAIGQVNPLAVFMQAEAVRKEESNYAVGRIFDVITEDMLDYAQFVNGLASTLLPTDKVTLADAWANRPVSRQQVMIDSGLITELDEDGKETGAKYFKVRRRNILANGTDFGWSDTTRLGGVNVEHKLYIYDFKQQEFAFLLSNGDVQAIGLGAPAVWDSVIRDIHATGNVRRYEVTLNALGTTAKERLVRQGDAGKQMLFWTVFKTLKVEEAPVEEVLEAIEVNA